MAHNTRQHPADEPQFEGLQVWHAFLLRKAGQLVTEQAEGVLDPLDMTLRQFGVLNVVQSEPGLNQRAVGEKLRIDRTTIVALVDALEQAGMLERRRGTDRRSFDLFLTERGEDRLREARKRMTEVHEHFLQPLSPAERELLRELLLRVATESR
ncbi:MarR family winged helix-turn-helix transcriptional regulator [Streptacidiphilus rugosus]|uniref:MarR family winged helix-turn-helix transcriptional regulator n=1 Tax=Streptacidiphilus rugosus TaxID=405783 RepID=UPI0006921DE5|nr:MarR family transcriptional regulator [Streptacidiphilus rugosus]